MKLMRAARRSALAGFAVAMSFGLAANAWAQTSECPDARVSGRVRAAVVPSTLLSVIETPTSTDVQLQQALNDCQAILASAQRGSVDALMCVARAQIRLADRNIDPANNYGYARCHAYRAGRLSSRDASRANAVRAEALVGLMRVNAGSADTYSRELLRIHDRQAPESVHRAVADMYVRQRNANGALTEARSDLTGTARALTLINIASMQGGNSRALLDEAYAADNNSVAVNSALGAAYFNLGQAQWDTARRHLEFATRNGQRPEAGYETLQLDAFYYLSVLETQNPNTLRDALLHADQAGNSEHARRQACLVRLVMGGDQIYTATRDRGRITNMTPSNEGQRACRQLGSSAEGYLLEGMFWLRYSQFRGEAFSPAVGAPGHAPWRDAVNAAEQAFENGRDALGTDNRSLGWPGWGDPNNANGPNNISLRAMLGYGDDLSDYFQSYCQGTINSTPEEIRAQDVFVNYKVVRSPSRPSRCLPPESN